MGRNLHKVSGFRFTDETLVYKYDVIAKKNKRSRTAQVEWVLDEYIRKYEKEYGEIPIDDVAIDN